jgi:hypothetical protein
LNTLNRLTELRVITPSLFARRSESRRQAIHFVCGDVVQSLPETKEILGMIIFSAVPNSKAFRWSAVILLRQVFP